MKTTMSVLFADMRGSAGGVTASKWKDTNYVRTKVTPANPNTAAQQAQRLAFTLCVGCWQGLTAAMKAAWTTLAQSKSISEFNAYMSANVAQEKTNSHVRVTPANADVEAPQSVAVDTSASPGGYITITWSQGDCTATDQLCVWYRETETSPWTYTEPAGVDMDDETYDLDVGAFEQDTAVAIAAKNDPDGYSLAQGGEATSSAEV